MMRARRRFFVFLLPMVVVLAGPSRDASLIAQDAPSRPTPIHLKNALVFPPTGHSGRTVIQTDALRPSLVAGTWRPPEPGQAISLPDGTAPQWLVVTAEDDGWLRHESLRGGYAYVSVEMDAPTVMILEGLGHSMVYVNGVPRAGDPYKTGYVRLPVRLREGANDFLFCCRRGELSAQLAPTGRQLQFNTRDVTLPDLIVGETEPLWAAVTIINASTDSSDNVYLDAHVAGNEATRSTLPVIPPCSVRKVPFKFTSRLINKEGECELKLVLTQRTNTDRRVLDSATVKLRVRKPLQTHKRTFVSAIDGSVQYYAVNPAQPLSPDDPTPALVLSLHGAGVEAIGQAGSYHPKTWTHIVAPTNRRPFGFDWEDWGRMDVLEVLDDVHRRLTWDRQRTYLTGHSMGGHGTWHIGATFPDRFAAIGPSAAWISFWSYADAPREQGKTGVARILRRCDSSSDTLALLRNYVQQGVYILHGEADDDVPVEQARQMREHLAEFHHDLEYHEQPGTGHWWDASDEPGTDCVDWEPMFRMFGRHVIPRPEEVRSIDFTTANPEVSARSHWVAIEAQLRLLAPSSVHLRYDPGKRRIVGKTDNVARLCFDLGCFPSAAKLTVQLDEQTLEGIPWPTAGGRLWLGRHDGKWAITPAPSPSQKGPHRYGPFKHAFRHRVVFVYGTNGLAEENAWAYAKARYDAETFWYRGNASVDLLPDSAFNPKTDPDRNVILYGNATTNAAWKALLGVSPVQVRRGEIEIGRRLLKRDDLACLFLRPRSGSDRASVGVVSGSGPVGMRLTNCLRYFVSGVAYPDVIVLGPEVLTKGSAGVCAAGLFGLDWSVEKGEFAWLEETP